MIRQKHEGKTSRSEGRITKKLVPPDGGWGWMIVLAYAVNTNCTIPIIQGFGLLFRGTCADLGMTATDISIIISVNSAFGMAMGLINGPLLRHFGYRKVAMAGAVCYALGLTLSSVATSFAHLVITYGLMCSLGTGISNSAFSLALNSYFIKKRGRAVGFAMTMTGLGPILVPQLITLLMSQYGARGAIAVLGALSLHALVAALLLQPLAWHLKVNEEYPDAEANQKLVENTDEDKVRSKQQISTSIDDLQFIKRERTMTVSSIDHDVDTGSIYGFETSIPRKKSTPYAPVCIATRPPRRRSSSSQHDGASPIVTLTDRPEPAYKWWSSGKSLDTINLGSSLTIFDDSRAQKASLSRENSKDGVKEDERRSSVVKAMLQKKIVETVKEEEDGAEDDDHQDHPDGKKKEEEVEEERKSILQRALRSIVVFFDFDLLRDPVYVNIMIGMSIAIFGEINFAILMPFVLDEMSFSLEQTATVMSSLAIADLIMRAISPFLGECLKQTPRMMYLFSLALLIATRSSLLFVETFTAGVIVGFAQGIAKGIRTVYMTLVISCYVPIERLASASGIQMVANGLVLMTFGPLLGFLKDSTGSYHICVIFINGVTALTITMWTIEIIVRKSSGKSSKSAKSTTNKSSP